MDVVLALVPVYFRTSHFYLFLGLQHRFDLITIVTHYCGTSEWKF